jgi:asparagine synthase (glutamine-hydrolysing)
MCGLVGYFGGNANISEQSGEVLLESMADQITRRGPDDAGYWYSPEQKIGLGHRRLSIVDLSPAGHQPMSSASGRYIIAFNGEIYNHPQLRKDLSVHARAWRGHSDTETLLAGFDHWGIQKTIELAVGMFAFAVWDRQEHILTLGRDRIGEKPLYYGRHGKTFLFGSEMKALKQHPAFRSEINRDAVSLLLRHNYIPAPYSIYQGISKLEPGCLLSVSALHPEPMVWSYWSVSEIAKRGVKNTFTGSPKEAVDIIERYSATDDGRCSARCFFVGRC